MRRCKALYSLGPKSPSRSTLLIPLLRQDGPKRLPPAHHLAPSFLFFSLGAGAWAPLAGRPLPDATARNKPRSWRWARRERPHWFFVICAELWIGSAKLVLAQAIKIGPRDLSSTQHPLGLADCRRKLKTEKGKEQVGCRHRRYGHPCLRRRSGLEYWLGGSVASVSRPC